MKSINDVKKELKEFFIYLDLTDFPHYVKLCDASGNTIHAELWVDGNGVDYSCDHAYWEHGDDDEQGKCPICGAYSDWHWEQNGDEEGHATAEPTNWYPLGKPQGVLGEIAEIMENEAKDGKTL